MNFNTVIFSVIALSLTLLLHSEEVDKSNLSNLIKYDDNHPSNLIAVVIGYQNVLKHKSGIDIPIFSLNEGAGDGKEVGILFYVLAPTNYSGSIFWVECPRGKGPFEDQSIPSEELFPKDDLHSFKMNNPSIKWMLSSKSHLNPRDKLSTWHLDRQPYFLSISDAKEHLLVLTTQQKEYRTELEKCERIIKSEEMKFNRDGMHWYKNDDSDKTKLYRENKRHKRQLSAKLQTIDTAIKDTHSQIQRFNKK